MSDDDEMKMPEHVRRELDERGCARRRRLLEFEREVILEGYADDEIYIAEESTMSGRIVDLDAAREQRTRPEASYTSAAAKALMGFYLCRYDELAEQVEDEDDD